MRRFFGFLGIRLQLGQKLLLGGALAERCLARAIGIMFAVARLAFGALWCAGFLVVHGISPLICSRLQQGAA